MQHYESSELINIGSGKEISIKELAEIIRDVVDYQEKSYSTHQTRRYAPKVLDN